jgi:hypothetical protein
MRKSASLRRTVLETYAALNSNDEAAIKDRFGGDHEALSIGVREADWHHGGDRIVQAFTEQARAMPGLTFEPGDLQAYEEGTVGWFADRPTLRCPGYPTAAGRLTGIAVLADGRWRAVQSHLSLPQAEEA